MFRKSIASVIASGLLFAGSANAFDLDRAVNALVNVAENRGYVNLQNREGYLSEGESARAYPYVSGKYAYQFTALCDEDCSDVDLRIYDDNGNLVDSDIATDDLPVVSISPRWSAKFKVVATMIKCSREPCRVVVSSFRTSGI